MSISRTTASTAHRRATVRTADGIALAVREYGPRDAESTVVLLHGHCLRAESWTYVRDALARYPGARIVGVGLIATAASGLADAGFGRLLHNPLISLFQTAVRVAPALMQRAKLLACRVFAPIVRAAEFGDRKVSPRVLALANAMHNQTSIVTMAAFLSSFVAYDQTDALAVLSRIPTLVVCGAADLMTPPAHSVAIAAAVDYADLVLIDNAGHSVILEQPVPVAEAIGRLLTRVSGTRTRPRRLSLAA
ncbi:alpha/beta hydrolase [Nocardia otitidiscaviarum]|uniref:alpha/beta fold hydrolase n=1 Tax=Nocardia otitidiscaviarum TaxID=1823 RepID=UPI001895CADA|nr:alpha/beta hydrolase [Nocardia otitidiscaviarum]MBF6240720.1 alpha/beta hydrolase [Nocardia otitidiscaviarum]